MSFHSIRTWTLCGLIGAFFQLALAYSLLSVSASLYIPSKFLKIFGLYIPCPCTGIFGYQNSILCFDNLLVKLPKRMISSLFHTVMRKFPFDLIFSEDQTSNLNEILIRERKYETGVLPLEGNVFSGLSFQNLIDKERGHEAKRKRITSLRQRTGIRRRRRTTAHENGKFSPFLLNGSSNTSFSAISYFPFEVDRSKYGKMESGLSDLRDDIIHEESNEEIQIHGLNSNDLSGESRKVENGSSSLEKNFSENETNLIEVLKRALEEEKAGRAALNLELEKERAASETAADEAMAMIFRLQNDKALIEMEAKQYQRLIEEKFAYDEEEMSILRDILIRKEIDNHFLEKEIEAYREIGFSENEQLKGPDEYESMFIDKRNHFYGRNGRLWKGKSMKDNTTVEAAQSFDMSKKSFLQNGKWKTSEENYMLDMEPDVQDIHVVDFKTSSCKEDDGERSWSSTMAPMDELHDSDLTNLHIPLNN